MTTQTDENRLGVLEGRIAEQSVAIQDLRDGQRQTDSNMAAGFAEVNRRFDQASRETNAKFDQASRETNAKFDQASRETNAKFDHLNSETIARYDHLNSETNARYDQLNARIDQLNDRFDRMFLAILGIGATLIGLMIMQTVVLLLRL